MRRSVGVGQLIFIQEGHVEFVTFLLFMWRFGDSRRVKEEKHQQYVDREELQYWCSVWCKKWMLWLVSDSVT